MRGGVIGGCGRAWGEYMRWAGLFAPSDEGSAGGTGEDNEQVEGAHLGNMLDEIIERVVDDAELIVPGEEPGLGEESTDERDDAGEGGGDPVSAACEEDGT